MFTHADIDQLPALCDANDVRRVWQRKIKAMGKWLSIACVLPLAEDSVPLLANGLAGSSNQSPRFLPIESRLNTVRQILTAIRCWVAASNDENRRLVANAIDEHKYDLANGLAPPPRRVVDLSLALRDAVLFAGFQQSVFRCLLILADESGFPAVDSKIRTNLVDLIDTRNGSTTR